MCLCPVIDLVGLFANGILVSVGLFLRCVSSREFFQTSFQVLTTSPLFFTYKTAAYFSPLKLDELSTIDNIRGVGDVVVPEGWFRSARIGRNRTNSRTNGGPNPHSPENHVLNLPSSSPTSNGNYYYSSAHSSPHHHHRQPSHPSSSPAPPSGYHHQTFSPPPPVPPMPTSHGYENSHHQLVPLEILTRNSGPRRDPADELLLRRFLPT